MNWLRKIWDEYSWLLFLPTILLIGAAIILFIVFARTVFVWIFSLLPAAFWGAFFGIAVLAVSYWFLKDDWKQEKFGWHLAPKTNLFIVLIGLAGILITVLSVVWFFIPNLTELIFSILIKLVILFVLMVIVIVGCGITVAQGILLLRRKDWSGIFLILISLVGFTSLNAANLNLTEKFDSINHWIGRAVFIFITLLQVCAIIYLYVLQAFRIDPWTFEEKSEKNTSRSEEGS